MANLLISKGALVDAKNDRGERPLDLALPIVIELDMHSPNPDDRYIVLNRALAKCLLRAGAATTGLAYGAATTSHAYYLQQNPPITPVDLVIKAGGWEKYALWHKQVLVGLVTKCQPMPDDAAGLVVDFYCPSGGS